MVRDGGREVKALLVLGDGEPLVTPCGGCRQRLREFAAPDAPIHLADLERVRRTTSLAELLPLSFGPDHLTA
jgi:cytidine deaminase